MDNENKMKWLLKLLGCKCEEKDKEVEQLKLEIEGLKTQINNLQIETSIKEPISYGTIKLNDVHKLLSNAFFGTLIYLSDEYYQLTSKEEAAKFSNETKVQFRKWVEEEHDCDNFSFASMGYWSQGLKSFAYGIAWSGSHAFNIMIDKDKQIWIIEPQSNMYWKLDDIKNNSMYFPLRLILI